MDYLVVIGVLLNSVLSDGLEIPRLVSAYG